MKEEKALEENLRKEEFRTASCDELRRPPEKRGARKSWSGEDSLSGTVHSSSHLPERARPMRNKIVFSQEAFLFLEREKERKCSSDQSSGAS